MRRRLGHPYKKEKGRRNNNICSFKRTRYSIRVTTLQQNQFGAANAKSRFPGGHRSLPQNMSRGLFLFRKALDSLSSRMRDVFTLLNGYLDIPAFPKKALVPPHAQLSLTRRHDSAAAYFPDELHLTGTCGSRPFGAQRS